MIYVVILTAWFTDALYRRVGWRQHWLGRFDKLPGAYEVRIGPVLIVIRRAHSDDDDPGEMDMEWMDSFQRTIPRTTQSR